MNHSKTKTIESKMLPLEGLSYAPPQVLGGIRLVPILRKTLREDLRLSRRAYEGEIAFVEVDRNTDYVAYVPHGLIANWTSDGSAVFGSQIAKERKSGSKRERDAESFDPWSKAVGLRKMVKREKGNQLRFLPLHVAMEGLLAMHFGGPTAAWTEYSRRATKEGLSPRIETVHFVQDIVGLEDALRLFEIHQNQVGILVFVADALASAFVLPHPADYALLHSTLLTDFFGDLLVQYGLHAEESKIEPDPIDIHSIQRVEDLQRAAEGIWQRWHDLNMAMAPSLWERTIESSALYRLSPFTLRRFVTDLNPKEENHIGESILADDGELMYLKTYRLTAAQCRRAYLLKQLAAHFWSLDDCAKSLSCEKNDLILRLENAGFGYLLHQHVLDAAHAAMRRK